MISDLEDIRQNTDTVVNKVVEPVYYFMMVSLHLIYVIVLFGIMSFDAGILKMLNIVIQCIIAAVLIWKFNPYRKLQIRESDRHILFGAALFLLTNLGFTEYFEAYFKHFADTIKNALHIQR
jgi:tryptophan-rich sensory protein